jgi:DNA-binding LacI/PurR family transcriptional regulator
VFEDVGDSTVPTVVANNRQGAYELTRRFIDAGHRRIAFIGSENTWPMIEQRFDGYREALQDARLPFDPALTRFEGEWDASTGGQLMEQLCTEPDPPTALLAGNDLFAVGAIKALKDRGMTVPDQMAVSGFDDFAFAEYTDPSLTTVRVPGFEMGHYAATKLIDRIEGKDESPTSATFPVDLKIRGSA